MKTKEYDFSKGKRGSVLRQSGKTRITIWVDNPTLEWFRVKAEKECRGYQTELNDALKNYIEQDQRPIRDIIKEAVLEGLEESGKTAQARR